MDKAFSEIFQVKYNLGFHNIEIADLRCLPPILKKDDKNPRNNIVDAYFIAELLRKELLVRRGFLSLQDLPERTMECFLRTTKSHPVNIPAQKFIVSEDFTW